MAARWTFRYDRVGDILYMDKCMPYAGQDSDELDDEIVVRRNPETGDIETLEVLFFMHRFQDNDAIELPVTGDLRLIEE